jgi:hypothetical protein
VSIHLTEIYIQFTFSAEAMSRGCLFLTESVYIALVFFNYFLMTKWEKRTHVTHKRAALYPPKPEFSKTLQCSDENNQKEQGIGSKHRTNSWFFVFVFLFFFGKKVAE